MSPEVPDPRDGTASAPEPGRRRRFRRAAKGRDGRAVRSEGTVRSTFRRLNRLSDRSHVPGVLLAVFVAGVLGTAARLGLDAAIPSGPGGMPVSTLLINTAGSFALGLLVAVIPHTSPEWLRAGVTTGLLGSFTTFSALTVASVELTGSGDVLGAATTLIVSVVAGVGAALAGIAVGSTLQRRRA